MPIFVEAAEKVYLLIRQHLRLMIGYMPQIDPDPFSLESDPSFEPLLNYFKENDELVCSVSTAAQFERKKICNLIKRMSDDGLVEMTPREKNLESFSLCLTEKGRGIASMHIEGSNLITNRVPGFFLPFQNHP